MISGDNILDGGTYSSSFILSQYAYTKARMANAPHQNIPVRANSTQGIFLNLSLSNEFSRMSISAISVCDYFLRLSTSSSDGERFLGLFLSPFYFKLAAMAPILIILLKKLFYKITDLPRFLP